LPRLAPALLQIADPGRIFYGSDWPFTPLPIVTRLAGEMDASTLFDDATRRRVLQDNALDLFPRLRVSGFTVRPGGTVQPDFDAPSWDTGRSARPPQPATACLPRRARPGV